MELYEILVPTIKPVEMSGDNRIFTNEHHREWDSRVINIANGMTVFQPSEGSWISPKGELFKERMIPVRIACNRDQIEEIIKLTASHYMQKAVMAYRLSEDVIIRNFA